jgi:hypothetical protein
MKTELSDYIKIYNIIPKSLCNDVVSELEKPHIDWKQHVFYFSDTNTSGARSGNKELSVSFSNIPSKTKLMEIYFIALKLYITELDFPWMDNWNGYTPIRFNRYEETKLMAPHCDHIRNIFDGERKGVPILSILSLLNDNFSGGEFVMFDNTEIKMNSGDVMIFPSNFLYPHTVKEVTKGVRYSAISWSW